MEKKKRYGSVIALRPEHADYYKKLHANPWPEVLKTIKDCHIENYSIYLFNNMLFSYFEYTGDDYDADMQKMASDPITQEWWKECKPCQLPLKERKESEWWADMDEVFHLD